MPTVSKRYCGQNMVANKDAKHLPVVIFAVNTTLNKESEYNFINAQFPGVKQAQGCYENNLEWSYITDACNIKQVIDLCVRYEQECIMLLDENRGAFMYYLNLASWVPLGYLHTTSPADAMDNHIGWTRSGSTFYVIKPQPQE